MTSQVGYLQCVRDALMLIPVSGQTLCSCACNCNHKTIPVNQYSITLWQRGINVSSVEQVGGGGAMSTVWR